MRLFLKELWLYGVLDELKVMTIEKKARVTKVEKRNESLSKYYTVKGIKWIMSLKLSAKELDELIELLSRAATGYAGHGGFPHNCGANVFYVGTKDTAVKVIDSITKFNNSQYRESQKNLWFCSWNKPQLKYIPEYERVGFVKPPPPTGNPVHGSDKAITGSVLALDGGLFKARSLGQFGY